MHIKRSQSVYTRHSLNIISKPSSVFSACRARWWVCRERLVVYQSTWITHTPWTGYRSSWKPCVSFLQDQNENAIQKTSSGTKLFRMARSHSTSTTSWELAFPKSHMVTGVTRFTTQVTQNTYHGLTIFGPVILERSRSLDISISFYARWVVFSLSSNVCHSKIFVEYPSFGNAGIQKTLLAWLKFSGCYSLVKFSCFVLPWKRHDPKLGRQWYRWESSHNHVFGALDELIFADNYTQLCTIEADLSRVPLLPQLKSTGNGSFYWLYYDIILLFGMTELKAQVAWKEGVSGLHSLFIFRIYFEFIICVVFRESRNGKFFFLLKKKKKKNRNCFLFELF